jgi:vanillate O-demethylase monooxygenase subunit
LFLKNAWYVAGTTQQLNEKGMISLTMLGEPVVIYRKANGTPVALEDRCVHRFAPLSLGRVEGDNLRCMYHGILFSEQGRALEIPGQEMIPPRACIKAHPIREVSGWLWVWMGEAEKASEIEVPPVYGIENPDWYLPHDELDYASNFQLINDNLTDLGHLAWVHSQSFGADETWTNTLPQVSPIARGIRINRWLKGIPPIPKLGKAATYDRVDHWAQLDYLVPGIFHFYNALYPVGTADAYENGEPPKDDPALLYEHYTQQCVTPMTEATTRYFYTWGPSARTGTADESVIMRQVLNAAFLEDKVIIERQQKIIELDPTRLPMPTIHDKGVTLFQRLMQRLMREERSEAGTPLSNTALEAAE